MLVKSPGFARVAVMTLALWVGIRLAQGAQSADVLRMVLKQGMLFTLIGLGLGLVAALALTRVGPMRALQYE